MILQLWNYVRKCFKTLPFIGSKHTNIFTVMSFTNHYLGSHYESGFHLVIKVLTFNGKGCLSLRVVIIIFESKFWGFVKVIQLNNGFTIKKNDDKENMVTNITKFSFIVHYLFLLSYIPYFSLFSICSLNHTYIFPLPPHCVELSPISKHSS